jgi:hypothetical protein
MDLTIRATDLAIFLATIAGPILAVWAAEWRQESKSKADRKEWVFRTLMSTRGAKLKPEHVAAINHIEFAFPKKSCPAIEDARALYRKQLRSADSISEIEAIRQAWSNRANELFAELLYLMALELKIPFTKSDITEESYHPDAHLYSEIDLREIRTLVLDVLKNGRPINIRPIHEDKSAAE